MARTARAARTRGDGPAAGAFACSRAHGAARARGVNGRRRTRRASRERAGARASAWRGRMVKTGPPLLIKKVHLSRVHFVVALFSIQIPSGASIPAPHPATPLSPTHPPTPHPNLQLVGHFRQTHFQQVC